MSRKTKVHIVLEKVCDHCNEDNSCFIVHGAYAVKKDADEAVRKLKDAWKQEFEACVEVGCDPNDAPEHVFDVLEMEVQ